jgi:hypothetical protein
VVPELIKAPAVAVWPPQKPDKRERTVRMIVKNGSKPRPESLGEIAEAETIPFDTLIELNFGVRRDPKSDQWARIINWYLKFKLGGVPLPDGNFRFKGGETIYVPTAAPKPDARPDTSPQAQAKAEVDAFAARSGDGKWPFIRRQDLIADLKERIDDPAKINQGDVGLCPPAALLYTLARADILTYARLVMDLFEHAKGRIRQWEIKPCGNLRKLVPTKAIKPADWIPMASIRDTSLWLQHAHDTEQLEGAFIPIITSWLKRAGYRTVVEDYKLLTLADRDNLERANARYNSGHQVLLMLTGSILGGKPVDPMYTKHTVVLASPVTFGVDASGAATVSMSVATWGRIQQVPPAGTLKLSDFLRDYFGFIACMY